MPTGLTPWRILADDLTGALDSAAAWCAHGPVDVGIEGPAGLRSRVQVVATGSRQAAPADLADRLAPCLDWFCTGGRSFKKIDSLLRGNTWVEIAWLLRSGRFKGAVLAPAYPAQGRFSQGGRHWVGPPLAPQQPAAEAFPLALHQALLPLGLSGGLRPPGSDLLGPGPALRVPDVLCDADLDALAALADSDAGCGWLWCASAGLAWALHRRWRSAAGTPNREPDGTKRIGAQVPAHRPAGLHSAQAGDHPGAQPWLVSASRHPVFRQQRLALASASAHRCFDWSDPEALDPETAELRLHARAKQLTQAPLPSVLLVVGGDTLLALVQASGTQRLQALPSHRPGWGCARWRGGRWDGVISHTRSGAFGPPDDLSRMLASFQ